MGSSMPRKKKSQDRKTLCIDFDGVIHSYISGWKGPSTIVDLPVPGALDWLDALIVSQQYEVCIYSSRSKDPGGVDAMKAWFEENEFSTDNLSFPTEKPAAWLTIDDRAICFRGTFPSMLEIEHFKPWYK